MDSKPLIRQPSAWLPIALSLAALALVPIHVARHGITHNADEGTAARVFQLLLLVQLPVIASFAIRWLPRRPRAALLVLALQLAAALAALALVAILEL